MEILHQIRGLIAEVTELYGVELVDLEVAPMGRRRVLRLLIDQPGGVTLKDCAFVSRKVSEALDQQDAVPFAYFLEVSSPGINRPLTVLQHVERFQGEPAEVELKVAVDGRRHFRGRLDGVEGGAVRLVLDEGGFILVEWDNVRRARLATDPWEQHRKGKSE
ncbi:MAG: ribosome maturation factor RimP [Candidatus Eisenbacteria bacterium]|nr:ribosome maturation factor RimP [Candidatus Eisenbacteria bacterium]